MIDEKEQKEYTNFLKVKINNQQYDYHYIFNEVITHPIKAIKALDYILRTEKLPLFYDLVIWLSVEDFKKFNYQKLTDFEKMYVNDFLSKWDGNLSFHDRDERERNIEMKRKKRERNILNMQDGGLGSVRNKIWFKDLVNDKD